MSYAAEQAKTVKIQAGEAVLQGKLYQPPSNATAYVIVHGATGVPQDYYGPFARWMTTQGLAVFTYDYRDFGRSATSHPRYSSANMRTWAVDDQSAVENAISDIVADTPIWLIGHSLGGLGIPFYKHSEKVKRVITVGAGLTHYTDHPWHYKPLALAFWFGLGPASAALSGYLPGRKIGFGADLPAQVYWQWRRWCTTRGFFEPDVPTLMPQPDFNRPSFEWKFVALSDDYVVPPVSVWRYADRFPKHTVGRSLLTPRDCGLQTLRHITVFSKKSLPAWSRIIGSN
jgi:predicted alpha/beta hydrolase